MRGSRVTLARMGYDGVDIIARGITARGARGCAFTGVSVDIEAGQLGVTVGSAGSGRTSLLLALAGRMRLMAGFLIVFLGATTLAVRRQRVWTVSRLHPQIEA